MYMNDGNIHSSFGGSFYRKLPFVYIANIFNVPVINHVIIEKDVWIGANVTILKGVTVAEGCVIGAGTVLTKSTHPYGIYVGVPGRRVSERFTNEELEDHINILQEKSKW